MLERKKKPTLEMRFRGVGRCFRVVLGLSIPLSRLQERHVAECQPLARVGRQR